MTGEPRVRLWALSSVLLVVSCTNVPADFRFDAGKATGLAIGSISYESGLGKYYLVAMTPASDRPVQFSFGCSVVPCLEPADDPAFSAGEQPSQRAGGFAVEVPEGRYRIVGWRVAQGAIQSRSTTPIDIDFVIERGKATYVGNLHFDRHWEDIRLRDRSGRDLPLLRQKYSALADAPLAFTVAPGVEVGKLGGAYQRRMSTPIFIPVVR